jgi:hypothetical protein
MSILTILPCATVKPATANGRPCGATTNPAALVHERRLCEPGKPREAERLLGHGRRTPDLPRLARAQGTAVGSEDDIGVEHRNERLEVTAARGGEEGVDRVASGRTRG